MSYDDKDTNKETQARRAVSKTDRKLLYDHTKFNEAMEIFIKLVDRHDKFNRVFAQQR